MATLFVRHKVEDFRVWKVAYDAFDVERTSLGVTNHGVYRADHDPNDVTVYHHFDNMDAAKEFAGSARLKTVMQEGGVVGTPDIWFADRV